MSEAKMPAVYPIFAGKLTLFGTLSNEEELAKVCPSEFFNHDNIWSRYAMHLYFWDDDTGKWKWKSENPDEQKLQKDCLTFLFKISMLRHEHQRAVAGWMLSEMLIEVPGCVSGRKN